MLPCAQPPFLTVTPLAFMFGAAGIPRRKNSTQKNRFFLTRFSNLPGGQTFLCCTPEQRGQTSLCCTPPPFESEKKLNQHQQNIFVASV